MSSSKKALFGVLAAIVVVVIGVFALFNLRDSGPEELVLGERATTTTAGIVDETDEPATTQTTAAEAVTSAPTPEGTEGGWTVSPASVAGYRVIEDFASGLSDFEAVGRTSLIEGELTIEGTSVTAASFVIDVKSIVSDDSRRDGQFSGRIMNAAEFPTADFQLTSPIDLGASAESGEETTVDATGDLTLRGVTNSVTFPLTARLVNGEIETLGSVPVVFADYGIDNPSFAAVAVRDEGVVEFSLIFVR